MSTYAERRLLFAMGKGNFKSAMRDLSPEDRMDLANKEKWIRGEDPLHYAALRGKDDIVRLMIKELGFRVNSYSGDKDVRYTALHIAVRGNKPSTVRILLEFGADDTLEGRYYDGLSGTARDWANKLGFDGCKDIFEYHAILAALGRAAVKREVEKVLAVIDRLKVWEKTKDILAKGKKIKAELGVKKANLKDTQVTLEAMEAALEAEKARVEAKKAELKDLSAEIAILESDKDFKAAEEFESLKAEIREEEKAE